LKAKEKNYTLRISEKFMIKRNMERMREDIREGNRYLDIGTLSV